MTGGITPLDVRLFSVLRVSAPTDLISSHHPRVKAAAAADVRAADVCGSAKKTDDDQPPENDDDR